MASTINLTYEDAEAVFAFSPVDRAALYGKRKRIALDANGTQCTKAALLDDGSMLLQSGMTAQGYFLPDGAWVPQGELEAINTDGTAAEKVPSTLGVPQPLAPAAPADLLDLRVHSVYALSPESIPDRLSQELSDGALFSFDFNFRADYQAEIGILLSNSEGYWAFIGVPTIPEWQELATVTEMSTADSGADDDLDFEMF